jgi:hypothetical protein
MHGQNLAVDKEHGVFELNRKEKNIELKDYKRKRTDSQRRIKNETKIKRTLAQDHTRYYGS